MVSEEDDDGNTYDRNQFKYKTSSAKKMGIKTAEGKATEAQIYRLEKLSEQHGFEMKDSYTKQEASELISKYLPKN